MMCVVSCRLLAARCYSFVVSGVFLVCRLQLKVRKLLFVDGCLLFVVVCRC